MCTNLSKYYAQILLDYNAKSCLLALDRNIHISHIHDNNSTLINIYPCQKHFHRNMHYVNSLKHGMCPKIFVLFISRPVCILSKNSGISGEKRIFFHFRRSKIAAIYLSLCKITFNKKVYISYSMKNVIRKI